MLGAAANISQHIIVPKRVFWEDQETKSKGRGREKNGAIAALDIFHPRANCTRET
jgi:hypothetical protein